MRKLAVAVALSLAVLPAVAAETAAGNASENPMAAWKPPRVTREAQDKKEIGALWKTMQAAEKAGDLTAAADLVDFPVLMMTDNSKGDGMGEAWNREKWTQVMEPFYKRPHPDMNATHKTSIFLMSDALASVDDVCTMKMSGKTMTVRNSTLLVKKNGKWLVKAMAEGGWGDMVASGPATSQGEPGGSAAGANQPADSRGTDTGTSTGSGAGQAPDR